MSAALAGLAALTWRPAAATVWYNRVPSPDDLWHVIPWFDHMIRAEYIHPYQTADVPRYTPAGTVPVTGGEPDWSAEWTTGKTDDGQRAQESLRGRRGDGARRGTRDRTSPQIPRDIDAAGDTLFQTYCAVCHGPAGDAKGPVSSRIGAPSLLTGAGPRRTATATSTASSATAAGSCRATATRSTCPATGGPS